VTNPHMKKRLVTIESAPVYVVEFSLVLPELLTLTFTIDRSRPCCAGFAAFRVVAQLPSLEATTNRLSRTALDNDTVGLDKKPSLGST
jgi:hypothetical protein